MKFSEIPTKLNCLLSPPEPIVINHSIVRGIGETQRSIYEIDVEVEDNSSGGNSGGSGSSSSNNNSSSSNCITSGGTSGSSINIRDSMSSFMMSAANIQELQQLDEKICDTLEAIKLTRNTFDLFSSFADDPHQFTNRWLASQSSDLKSATEQSGDSEEERRAEYYYQPWLQEAVCRYFYRKIQERRGDLDVL